MGKQVPEDIQIIGYDGLQFLNQGEPIVSSIAQPVHEIAKEAVRCLNELIANGKTEGNNKDSGELSGGTDNENCL